MENPSDHSSDETQQTSEKKGGLRTMPFIIANETFEKVASFGLLANMILYLTTVYNMDVVSAASVLFIWSATSNFVPLIGAFVSDSYFGRYRVIALGSIVSLLGMIVLWLTSEIPHARPPKCTPQQHPCKQPTSPQLTLLLSSFVLMSIGAGGIRPCSLAFGADQLNRDNPNKARVLQSFFNWYYVSVGASIMVSVTVIVYIQEIKGWGWGFGVPVILMFFSTLFFFMGSSLYIKVDAYSSMLTGLARAAMAAFRNRHLALPPKDIDGWYHYNKGSKLVAPTDNLRFLNKACIIRTPNKDLNPNVSSSDPWTLCTVEEVETLKILIRVIPIWSTGIMIAVSTNQNAFPVLQANTMDRHMGRNFKIPAGSFGVFGLLTMTLWVAIYDRLIVPIVVKFTGKSRPLTLKQRMGIGLLLSVGAMAVSAIVEGARRRTAIRQGLRDNGKGLVDMSAMWLVPQHCLNGLSETFNAIGQIEFYYNEFPESMASVGVALFSLGIAVGNLIGSLLVQIVNGVTKRGGKDSWVSDNLNKGHYDYYYWLLCILSLVNFGYYIVCGWAYGPVEEETRVLEEKKQGEEIGDAKSKELAVILN